MCAKGPHDRMQNTPKNIQLTSQGMPNLQAAAISGGRTSGSRGESSRGESSREREEVIILEEMACHTLFTQEIDMASG